MATEGSTGEVTTEATDNAVTSEGAADEAGGTDNFAAKKLRNGKLAGGNHPSTSVPFDSEGFPDFSEHLYDQGPKMMSLLDQQVIGAQILMLPIKKQGMMRPPKTRHGIIIKTKAECNWSIKKYTLQPPIQEAFPYGKIKFFMVEFYSTENKITIDQIRSLETKYGLSFPDEYVNHLMKYNGGKCKPNLFEFDEKGKVSQSRINRFFAIYDGEYNNLEDYIIMYKVDKIRIPQDFIPIAGDPGGNLICISKLNGCIYFWDHEKEMIDYQEELEFDNVYLISKNLPAFFYSLK